MSARPLVVGAAGQVGKALTHALGPNSLKAGRNAPTGDWLQVDLAALAHDPNAANATLDAHQPTAIYCVGGATDVERCETDQSWANDVNCDGPIALARATAGTPFVFFSTDYIFDGHTGPYTETAATNPLSVYGRSKLLGEQGVLAARPDALIIRTTIVYGPDAQQKNYLYTLRRILSEGKPMRVAADQISTPTYNEDLALATIALLEGGHQGIVNVAGPELISRFDFSIIAANILGLDTALLTPIATSELNQKAARPLASGLLIDKLRTALPNVRMRTNAQAITEWKAAEAAKV